MRITYNDKLNKLLNPYLESLLKEKSSLEPETLTLFDLFMEDLDMGGRYGIFSEILEPRLEEIIREENIESIANLMDGKNSPTVQTLDIICKAFGISVSQFFNPEDAFSGLSDVQKDLLTAWAALDDEKRKLLLAFMQSLQQDQP